MNPVRSVFASKGKQIEKNEKKSQEYVVLLSICPIHILQS